MTHRRRLLMTVDAVGGVWTYATELAAGLGPLGYDVTLAVLGPAPTAAQRDVVAGIGHATLLETGLPLDWLAADAATVVAGGGAVAAIADAVQADIVHLNQPALAAARPQAPTVAVVHSCVETWWQALRGGDTPPDLAWQTRLVARGLAAADAVVCPTAAFAAAVQRTYALPCPPIAVHNGRTPPAGTPPAMRDFAFTAGRLWDTGKNVATLDRAAARLNVPFEAAGPLVGPNGERIAFAHLHALGHLDEAAVAACLAVRPVFVSAARYEPFGLAVLEAALAGCALVLADIPTFRELWDGAATFVDVDDAAGFAEAVEASLGDPAARLRHGDLARRRAGRFTPHRMAAGMAAIYDRLGDRGRSVAA